MPPRLSIVIPVWNDSVALAGCLDRLRAPTAPASQIIVCDASPDPAEQDRVRALATAHQTLVLPAPLPSRGSQLAAGAAAATGDIIVFSHADTHLDATHLHALLTRLDGEPAVHAGAFHRDVASLYPRLAWASPLIHWYMAELGTIYGDQSPFIRRATLARLGGYPTLPIMEDIAFSDLLRRHLPHHEIALLHPTLPTSPRRFHHHGPLRTKCLNLALTAAWRAGLVSPQWIHQYYYRHRTEGRGQ